MADIPEIDIKVKIEKIVTGRTIKFHILKPGQVYRRIKPLKFGREISTLVIVVLELNKEDEDDGQVGWWAKRGSCIFDNGMVTTINDVLPTLSEDHWELIEELSTNNGK